MLSLIKTIGMEKIPRFSLQFRKLHLPLHRIPMGKSSRRWRMKYYVKHLRRLFLFKKIANFFNQLGVIDNECLRSGRILLFDFSKKNYTV